VTTALSDRLAGRESARVVQVSDTHLSSSSGLPRRMQWVLDWILADPPDLVVHTGDIVLADPDDDADRAFARLVFDGLPCPVVAIPGNHDIGFYDEPAARERRVAAFVATWGADRFALDIAGWRLVGANAYRLGEAAHDEWFGDVVQTAGPVAVFIHQPVGGDPADGWEMPRSARASFDRVTAGTPIQLVASGHRHRAYASGRAVWAPSVTLIGEAVPNGGDPMPGAVEFTFSHDGSFTRTFVRSDDLGRNQRVPA